MMPAPTLDCLSSDAEAIASLLRVCQLAATDADLRRTLADAARRVEDLAEMLDRTVSNATRE